MYLAYESKILLVYNNHSYCAQLDRHTRRLDQDLSRFTIELEADTAGITELLEQSMLFDADIHTCAY